MEPQINQSQACHWEFSIFFGIVLYTVYINVIYFLKINIWWMHILTVGFHTYLFLSSIPFHLPSDGDQVPARAPRRGLANHWGLRGVSEPFTKILGTYIVPRWGISWAKNWGIGIPTIVNHQGWRTPAMARLHEVRHLILDLPWLISISSSKTARIDLPSALLGQIFPGGDERPAKWNQFLVWTRPLWVLHKCV